MLWETCFQLAPDESKRFALGLWNHTPPVDVGFSLNELSPVHCLLWQRFVTQLHCLDELSLNDGYSAL